MSALHGAKSRLECVALLLLGGCAALFLVLSSSYSATASLFPRWVAIASLLSLAGLIVQLVARRNSPGAPDGRTTEPTFEIVSRKAIFAGQAAYIVVIYLFGFFAATFMFLMIAPIQMRFNRWRLVLAQSVIVTVVIAGAFVWIFKTELPRGVIWDLL